tara:strand:- start:906 stop:1133 length:228 start_codon:yes stop_codon:yes gene_type:complete
MKLTTILTKLLKEASVELKKEENMDIIKEEIITPVVKRIMEELSPYFIKLVISGVSIIIVLLITILLNIKVIFKN